MFDYHIHSDFSADCETPMEKTIERGIDLGLKEICFTEHIDYDYPDKSIVFEFDLEAYDRKIENMKSVYGEKIKIKKGLEIGIQPHLLNTYDELLKKESFDFVICSMHTTEKKDLHSGAFFKDKTVDEAYSRYYQELLDCVKRFSNFSILGHIDLVKRYAKNTSNRHFYDIIEQIFKQIIPEGKGIELNTSGFRYGLESGMPSVDLLRLYKDSGGEILTVGSDSHIESTLGYRLKDSLELLQSIGFKYITTFKGRKPEFLSIESIIR